MTGDPAQFQARQARPEPALVERTRKKATTWINAVHMQFHRAKSPLINPDDSGAEAWRQEINLHFLKTSRRYSQAALPYRTDHDLRPISHPAWFRVLTR